MTILIGLRCADGGVLACDSQETRTAFYRFWPKLLPFDERFVLASTGGITLPEAVARRLSRGFATARREGPLTATRALEVVDETLLGLAREIGEEAVKGRQFLMGGLSDEGEVCLWAVDNEEVCARQMRTWECYGSGIDMADMLLRDFYWPEIRVKQAVPLLAYVVGVVEEVVPDCGGPVGIATVEPGGVRCLSSREVEEALGKIRPLADALRKDLPRALFQGKVREASVRRLLEETRESKGGRDG